MRVIIFITLMITITNDAVGNNTDTEVKQLSLGFVKFEMKITEDHLQVQSLSVQTFTHSI